MRLVLIGPVYPFRGGIAHYTSRLHEALRNRGHLVLLVSFKRQYPQWLFPGKSDRDPSTIPLRVDGVRYWIDSLNPVTWIATFLRICRFRPDLIIQQWWTPFWAPAWTLLLGLNRLLMRRPMVVICHNVLPHESRWWDPWLAKMTLRWSARFITQSAEEKEKLTALIPTAQVDICPLPVFDFLTGMQMSRTQALKLLSLPEDIPLLLFFGIVREYKGLDDLLRALPEIRAQLGKVLLLVAGEFWDDKQQYLHTISRLGIGDSVRIDDRYLPNEEVAIYFSAADILVAPYRRVTGSGVVAMARGFGIPILTTRVGEMANTAESMTTLLVPPSDPDALAAQIIRFFNSRVQPIEDRRVSPEAASWDQLVTSLEVAESRPQGDEHPCAPDM